MVVFPHAKINLGLQILRRRKDGFHDIATGLVPIPLYDLLEILPANETIFTTSGLAVEGDPDDNLCMKAYRLLQREYSLPPVSMHLHKIIPMGAGLGGGSSDAAFVLSTLNDLFELSLTTEELEHAAATLGSDCPFFITGTPAIATGTGTTLEPVGLDLSGFHVLLVYPGVHVSTAEAYADVRPREDQTALRELIALGIGNWQNALFNDFEPALRQTHPPIDRALKALETAGAVYRSLSGSGSAVFGLFSGKPPDLPTEDGWQVFRL